MAKRALTQLFVERIGPPKTGRVEYWDSHLAGFGLRVSATGSRSWICMYRVKGTSKQVRETLGSVDDIPNVGDARQRALESIEKARAKINPVAERKAAANATKAQTAARFAAVADRFLAEYVERNCRPNTIKNWRRILETDVKPKWSDRSLSDISKADVLQLLNDKAAMVPKQADEVRKVLRRMCSWAVEENIISSDPTATVARRVKHRESRDRVLTDGDIRLFWAGCDRLGWPFGPAFKLLLLTAQRRDEICSSTWREYDLANAKWVIPAERAKNKKPHEVHLAPLALEILKQLPRTGDLLFASRGTIPSGFSKVKARLDTYMTEAAGAPVEPWVLHDLRRTAASGMAELGIAPQVVDRVLNHVAGAIRGVARIYLRYEYGTERGAALDAWARRVASLVTGGPENVVELRQRA